jgi:uncharacterized membrane protein YccC
MDSPAFWKRLRRLIGPYRPQLRYGLRVTVSGLLAFAIARGLAFPLHGLWVVLTAVVVTQVSVGGSVRATVEYVIGTLGGALYAAVIGVLIPHMTAVAQGAVLALTIGPLAFAAAISPMMRVAPFSAVLVLLVAGQLGEGPIESALVRLAEVAIGGAVAIAVSSLLFPERAYTLGAGAAADVLDRMASALGELLGGFTQRLSVDTIRHTQDELGEALAAFQQIAAEATHEYGVALWHRPDPAPLARTLLRLRHDLVIVGRAAVAPLPDAVAPRLGPLLEPVSAAAGEFLHGSAIALRKRHPPPALQALEATLDAYEAEQRSLRNDGATRPLSSSEVERLFALGFALEELRSNFRDLARCVRDNARALRAT